jgi:tetraprenyl-beta-curcumene synthase
LLRRVISRFACGQRLLCQRSHKTHPADLSLSTLAALAHAALRELIWGLRDVSREVRRWRALAANIPDATLRDDALQAIDRKRANIDGAALFWILPSVRSKDLLQLLVAYEVLADFLDCTSERGAHAGISNGLRLHSALIEALDPQRSISDYYHYHPWTDDGGYVNELVASCRKACLRLPSYETVRPLISRATYLAQVLALNHETDPLLRDTRLRAWADLHAPPHSELAWFEWTGGASAWLTILALLALGAEPERDVSEAEAVYQAYLPWVSLAGTMLDSYGDVDEDTSNVAHSYVSHYSNTEVVSQRLAEIIRCSLSRAATLRHGQRHVVLSSCMVAMYLSKDSVRTPERRATTRDLSRAGGPLTELLLPALRLWRVFYQQRST